VQAFLDGHLSFDRIAQIIESSLAACSVEPGESLEQVLHADRCARSAAQTQIAAKPRRVMS
jgi:1-deoxy-D-xylulose 5-phosphate reductoisomerase